MDVHAIHNQVQSKMFPLYLINDDFFEIMNYWFSVLISIHTMQETMDNISEFEYIHLLYIDQYRAFMVILYLTVILVIFTE